MTNKNIILIGGSILAVSGLTYLGVKYYKKYKDTDYLVPEIGTFKFDWENLTPTQIVSEISSGYANATFSMKLKNMSTSRFTINSVFVKAYTMDDVYLAGQLEPFTEKIVLEPNSVKEITLKIDVGTAGLIDVAKQLKGLGLITLASNYYTKGIIGTSIKVKGTVSIEGLKFLSIPIDEVIDI